ncbi:hypothetical protein C0995_015080, partial [Termitomyces sp. Mi166
MAVYSDEFTIQETFLDRIPAEMRRALICNDNLSPEVNTVTEFLAYAIRYKQSAHTATHYDQCSSRRAQGHHQPVKCRLPAGQRLGPELTGNAPVAKESQYMPGAGQPGPKEAWDGPPRVSSPKVAFGSGNAGYKPRLQGAESASASCTWAAANSDVESNAEEDQEELINDKEAPPEVEELEGDDNAESVHIDGDEYVAVDVYDNEYYAHDDEEEHLFALTEHQGDKRI